MNEKMKKICRMLEGKFDSEADVCNLKLKNMTYKDGYLNIDFDNSSLTVHSWDPERDLPSYLTIALYSKSQRDFLKKPFILPREMGERTELMIKRRKQLEQFDIQSLIEEE